MYRTKKSGMQILISIIVAILAAALLGGAIFGVVKLVEYNKSETQKPSLSWEVGALDANGEYRADKGSIYTKAPFGCQGLNVELDFDATVSYQIYFYDTDSEFLSSTGTLNKNFNEKSVPFTAAKARIVVTPKDDESISWTEKNGYAKQLTITVLKDQSGVPEKVEYTAVERSHWVKDIEGADDVTEFTYYFTDPIDVSGYSKVCIRAGYAVHVFFGDVNGKNVGERIESMAGDEVGGVVNSFIAIPKDAQFLRVGCTSDGYDIQPYQIYLVK